MARRTKIVATVGPATSTDAVLAELFAAGVDVVRIGLAHDSLEAHLERIRTVRRVAAESGHLVGILADLPGPKVRAGPFPDGGVFLAEGDMPALVPGSGGSTAARITVDYDGLLEVLDVGDPVALGDGAIQLRVERLTDHTVVTRVEHGGRLQGRPGVHVPAGRLDLEVPTPHDLTLLDAVADAGVDLVAVSFVRSAADVERAVRAAGPDGPRTIAKIETRAGFDALDEIVPIAHGLMVARGDLGAECAIEDVPHLQKAIVRTCVAWGRPVITATQMLESMIHSPVPTRAEASDVANAVFDGTDAVMLSGETAIGQHPVRTVRTMARIAERAEAEADYVQWGARLGRLQRRADTGEHLPITGAVTHAAWRAALEIEADAVVCCTRNGLTARAVARFRPTSRLVAASPVERTVRQLALTWGCEPIVVREYASTDEMIGSAISGALESGCIRRGDTVVVVAGTPDRPGEGSNTLRVVTV